MNNIACRILLLALLGLAAPLFATSPERLVGGTVSTAASSWRRSPAAASDGNGFFVVWSDGRSRWDAVVGTRVTRDGQVLDPLGIRIPSPDRFVETPQVVWDGGAYLVVWTAVQLDGSYLGRRNVYAARVDRSINVYAARVTAGLTLLDPAPLLVAATGENDYRSFGPPSVASNGTDWVVVADLDQSDVLARRVLQNGTVEGDAPAKIGQGMQPAVAWDGARYAVVWKEGHWTQRARPIFAAALPASGALVATRRTFVTTSAAWSAPAITSTATAYTKVSFLPEHTGVERTFFRVLDRGAQRGRVVRR